MKFTPNNFLQNIRNIVTGGGFLSVTPFGTSTPQLSSLPANDSGFNQDYALSLGDAALATSTVLVTDSAGFRALSTAASHNTVATWEFIVPRDYDQQSDKFLVRIAASMNGNTDSPTLTLIASTLLPAGVLNYGVNPPTLNSTITVVAGSTVIGSTATAYNSTTGVFTYGSTLSSTQQVFEFPMTGMGLFRDKQVALVLSTGAHTTNAVQVYAVEVVYNSCLVAFIDSSLGLSPADEAGFDVFNQPLR